MTLKEDMGFANGYIIIFRGANYSHKDFFKNETCAKYSPLFKWYIKSEEDLPDYLPDGVTSVKLMAEDVFVHDNLLKDEDDIKDTIDYLTSVSRGKFVGEIGETIAADVVVENTIPIENRYGKSYINIMVENNDIVYIWITKTKMEKGKKYNITGIIKDHKEYKNELQNIITNCKYMENMV